MGYLCWCRGGESPRQGKSTRCTTRLLNVLVLAKLDSDNGEAMLRRSRMRSVVRPSRGRVGGETGVRSHCKDLIVIFGGLNIIICCTKCDDDVMLS